MVEADGNRFVDLKGYIHTVLSSDIIIERMVRHNLQATRALNLATLKKLFELSDDDLYLQWREHFVNDFLKSFLNGNALEMSKVPIEQWKEGVNLAYDKDELKISDITSFYYKRKLSLLEFIPEHTSSIATTLKLVKEIESYFKYTEEYAHNTFVSIRQGELKEKENFIQQVAASTPDIIFVYDLSEKKYVYINKNFSKILGYDEDNFKNESQNLIERSIHPEDREIVHRRYDRYKNLSEGEISEDVFRLKDVTGKYKYISSRAMLFKKSKDGIPLQVLGTARDITQEKTAEDELRQSELKYRLLTEYSTDMISRASAEGILSYASPSSELLLGFSPPELVGKNAFDFYHPDDLKLMQEAYTKVANMPDIATVTYRTRTKSGKYIWVESTGRTIRNAHGDIVEIHGVTRNVTDRVVAEQNLEKEREYLAAVFESVSEGIVSCDNAGKIILANKATRNFQEVGPTDLPPEEWGSYYSVYEQDGITPMKPEEVPLYKILLGKEVNKQLFVMAPKEGKRRLLCATGKKVINSKGEVLGAVLAMSDITEQKQVEEKLMKAVADLQLAKDQLQKFNDDLEKSIGERTKDLLESEERFRNIANEAPAFIFIAGENGKVEFINKTWSDFTGITLEDIQKASRATHPDDAGLADKCYAEAVKNQEPYSFEVRQKDKDGSYKWTLWKGIPRHLPDGKFIGMMGIGVDIDERKKTENALRDSEEKYRFLAESIPQILWTADGDGKVDYYNQKWYDLTGLNFREAQIIGWKTVVHPDDLEAAIKFWTESINNQSGNQVEYRLKRSADGEYRWHLGRSLPLKDSSGKVIKWFGTATDIHDTKFVQQNLSEKNRILETINKIGKRISAEIELDKLVQEVTDATTELTGAQFGAFFYNMVNEKGEYYTLYSISGVAREKFSKFPLPRNTQVFEATFHNTGTLRSDDITKDPRYGKNSPYKGMPEGHLPVKSYLAVSVVSRTGEVLGGLFFGHSEPGVFTKDIEAIIEGVAAQAAIAIDNSRLFEKQKHTLESLSVTKDQLSSINVELSGKNEQLERINNDLDNFIYTASHDLKAPISNIEGLLLALKENKCYSDPEINPLVDMMGASVDRFKNTIMELTDISKIQKAFIEDVEEIELVPIIEEVSFSIHNLIKEKNAKITVDPSTSISLHFSKKNLRSILYNLISNGIKYHDPKRDPEILISASKENGYNKLIVKDNGLGISSENISKLYTMFKRFHTHVEGSGIGLYIVKRIIENSGGKIEVKSEVGIGTEFILYFPNEKN